MTNQWLALHKPLTDMSLNNWLTFYQPQSPYQLLTDSSLTTDTLPTSEWNLTNHQLTTHQPMTCTMYWHLTNHQQLTNRTTDCTSPHNDRNLSILCCVYSHLLPFWHYNKLLIFDYLVFSENTNLSCARQYNRNKKKKHCQE